MTIDGSSEIGKYENGTITLVDSDIEMVFVKAGENARTVPSEEAMANRLLELVMAAME